MKRKSKPQKMDKMKFFLYRGFFHCAECGYTITADKKIKKSGKEYIYYYCTKKNPDHKCTQNVFMREEKISSQISEELKKVSLPDDCADWMITELKKERIQSSQSSDFFVQKTEKELSKLDEKLEKLMNAYLESVLNIKEYQKAKNVFINQKQVLKDKLKSFEQKSNNRFELADKFIKDSKQAKIIASKEPSPSRGAGRDFLKKIGSNFQIQNQNISFSPRGAWQTVAKSALSASPAGEATAPQVRKTSENSEIVNWRNGRGSNPRPPA
ncbi:zinc ribbon domain-containing protein [Patescibacteria group bacterium]|nr:zinc ribbon domain-containing protein [Patescibacteria group bacterium]MBU2416264.1 zinc ribbon domain-containing protein [Patescibacteria group bacterium]MBU2456994.1 zinc ribbon domain-containing protein [Patescibacteria group bacterium]